MAIRVGQTEPTASRRFRITSAGILPLRPLIMGKIHKDHGRLFGDNLIIHAIELNLNDTSGKDITAGLILVLAVNTRYLSSGIKLLRCISPFHTLEIFAWVSELNLLTSKLLAINSRIAQRATLLSGIPKLGDVETVDATDVAHHILLNAVLGVRGMDSVHQRGISIEDLTLVGLAILLYLDCTIGASTLFSLNMRNVGQIHVAFLVSEPRIRRVIIRTTWKHCLLIASLLHNLGKELGILKINHKNTLNQKQ